MTLFGGGMLIQQHTIDTPYMVGPVHCYSGELHGELVLFDTGPPTPAAKRYLQENIDLDRLRYVLVTHCHIDHYGLAYWLERETDAEIYIPYRDHLKIQYHEERLEKIIDLLKGMGFAQSVIEAARRALPEKMIFPPYPQNCKVVEEDFPTHLGIEYVKCPGHSQSDLIFSQDDWAITGDVLLRGIFQSPLLDVDLKTGKRFRNYEAYCSTLGKLIQLREKKIFPGHRKRIKGLDATILFYIRKMLDRVERMQPLTGKESVAELIDRLFGSVLSKPFHVYLKASEIIFMQDFLAQPLFLKNALMEIGLFVDVEEQFLGVTTM